MLTLNNLSGCVGWCFRCRWSQASGSFRRRSWFRHGSFIFAQWICHHICDCLYSITCDVDQLVPFTSMIWVSMIAFSWSYVSRTIDSNVSIDVLHCQTCSACPILVYSHFQIQPNPCSITKSITTFLAIRLHSTLPTNDRPIQTLPCT